MNGFKNFMNVVNTRGAAAAAILAGGLVVGAAPASANPVDPVSNPDKLKYSDVEMKIPDYDVPFKRDGLVSNPDVRSEEHTSELQSLMRISYAVFCLKKKKINRNQHSNTTTSDTLVIQQCNHNN